MLDDIEKVEFLKLCRNRYYQYAVWSKDTGRNNLSEHYLGICDGLDLALRVLAEEPFVLVGSPFGYERLIYKKF